MAVRETRPGHYGVSRVVEHRARILAWPNVSLVHRIEPGDHTGFGQRVGVLRGIWSERHC